MDSIWQFFKTPIYESYTVMHLGIAILVLGLGAVGVGRFARKKTEPNQMMRPAFCAKCGWRGQVSTHNRKCPKCNADIGNMSRPA